MIINEETVTNPIETIGIIRRIASASSGAEDVDDGQVDEDEDKPRADGEDGSKEPDFEPIETEDARKTDQSDGTNQKASARSIQIRVEIREQEEPKGGKDKGQQGGFEQGGAEESEVDFEGLAGNLHGEHKEDELGDDVQAIKYDVVDAQPPALKELKLRRDQGSLGGRGCPKVTVLLVLAVDSAPATLKIFSSENFCLPPLLVVRTSFNS